ncbi:MAG: hypothetical protein J6C46_12750 [Clostridia bacterium]|nr:hypothetical protein [Clostridia bacterium]
MKIKHVHYIVSFLIMICLNMSVNYAYSDSFNLLIETMNIPQQNMQGKALNEDIYNKYKLFVYGNPLDSYNGQRWKDVKDGNWTKNGGSWNGTGIRGEYWILGCNYNGKEVHNHLFPVDIEPPTSPINWRYAIIPDALESWQETDKYMDDLQKEYMITQKLTRNNVTYDLTVKDIGFDKVRIENYATWKTKGTVYTQRYDMNNKKWAANFMVPAMAADASLEGFAEFLQGNEYYLKDDENELTIPITYGSKVINLTDYAKKEHVKEIKSQLYINGKYIEEVYKQKETEVKKDMIYTFNKSEYVNNGVIILNIQIKSTLITTFLTDGALVDVKNYTLYINTDSKEEEKQGNKFNSVYDEEIRTYPDFEPPKITSIEINRRVNGVEKALLRAKKTNKEFVCAGQTIRIKVKAINIPQRVTIEFEGDSSITTFDELTKLFEWTEPKNRNQRTLFKTLKGFENMYDEEKIMVMNYKGIAEEEFEYVYVIPYKTEQTLHSWSTLREISKDAFNINENKLFTRIKRPYEIVFKVSGPTGTSTARVELDVFERWDTLYNRDLSKYIKAK